MTRAKNSIERFTTFTLHALSLSPLRDDIAILWTYRHLSIRTYETPFCDTIFCKTHDDLLFFLIRLNLAVTQISTQCCRLIFRWICRFHFIKPTAGVVSDALLSSTIHHDSHTSNGCTH